MQSFGGLYQDRVRFVDATPPAESTNAPTEPGYVLPGMVAGDPSTFVAHGVSTDYLGSYPGGARASQIEPDLTGPQLVSPAKTRDGYGLRGAGTPEQAQNGPDIGPVRRAWEDSFGHVPIMLLVVAAGAWFLTQHKGSVLA